ncbi:alpha-2,8-sialyltransferase 8E [Carlito syrichta]|uniref:Alpha-2,8-sialyltransferase 8E n=1 Tax=Carlito syrichta TaxID=1868482 RepID=A0A3Q0E2B1_CARSF|nr:alpha-2,8-sialyltransferase 8E [Carlito syrichta]
MELLGLRQAANLWALWSCGPANPELALRASAYIVLPVTIPGSLQFGWQSGDQLPNWTGLSNVTEDPAVQSGSDSSSRWPACCDLPPHVVVCKGCCDLPPSGLERGPPPCGDAGLLRRLRLDDADRELGRPGSCFWPRQPFSLVHWPPSESEAPGLCQFGFGIQRDRLRAGACWAAAAWYQRQTWLREPGDFRGNSPGLVVSVRVKQSELFDRWRRLQVCEWAPDISAANQFKATLSRCCNAPTFLFTTQKNTPLGTKLKYEVDTSGIYPIHQEIFRMFPKDMPYDRSQFKKCAVVGNGGILRNSRCGREINSADFVFRCNLPPISEKYTVDVGVKTDVVTVNPSIITERFHRLEKWRRPFYRALQAYENASVLLPAFYNTRNTDVAVRVKYALDDFESPQAVYFFHPQYLANVSRHWLSLGVRAKRVSTGLILATAALELCREVHLFGFWAFPMSPAGRHITHHYYDNVKPRPGKTRTAKESAEAPWGRPGPEAHGRSGHARSGTQEGSPESVPGELVAPTRPRAFGL